jgi:hypothetical protein
MLGDAGREKFHHGIVRVIPSTPLQRQSPAGERGPVVWMHALPGSTAAEGVGLAVYGGDDRIFLDGLGPAPPAPEARPQCTTR